MELRVDDIKRSLDVSSGLNRTLLISFYGLMVYLIITIASVNAADLFFPNHTLSLPILRIDLNITYFFAATPILILVVHTNLLVNLSHHRNKLEAYIQEDADASPMYYHPFLYNFIRKRPDRHEKYRFATTTLLRIFIWTSLVVLPLFVLLVLQIRFLPVQTGWVNIVHVVLVFIDAVVLWWFRTAISTQPYPDKPRQETEAETPQTVTSGPPMAPPQQAISLQKGIKRFLVIFTPGLSLVLLIGSIVSPGKSATFHFDLREMVLAETKSDVKGILGSAPKLETAWAELAMGDKVENKSVRHGNFDRSIFTRISFRGSDLSHSSFQYTRFEYVNFQDAKAFDTDFSGALIRVGLFYRTQMDSARFDKAELVTADFDSCVMRYGRFSDAKVYGASFVDADLSGADFAGAKLAGADFSNAILDGADFSGADLTGANFSNAQLRGTMFFTSQLDCADFTNAIMPCVLINNCRTSGTTFNGSILDGAILSKIEPNCLTWTNISNPKLIELTVKEGAETRNIDAAWYAEQIPEKVRIAPQFDAQEPRAAFLKKLTRIQGDCDSTTFRRDMVTLDTLRFLRFRDSLFCVNAYANARSKDLVFLPNWIKLGRRQQSGFDCPEE